MNNQTIVGGARFGLWNATWPLARLYTSKPALHLKICGIKSFDFPATRVISLTKYILIPYIGWGIRITHDIESYPNKIIFWTFERPDAVLARILEAGFIASGIPAPIKTQSEQAAPRNR